MNGTATSGCHLSRTWPPGHISSRVFNWLLSGSRKCLLLFHKLEPYMGEVCPDGIPPFILVLSRRTPLPPPSSRYRCTNIGCNTLSWCSFPPPSTVCVSFCPVWSFSLQSCLRLININHVTDSVLCCLEIASTGETNPLLFNLASGELLGQRQEAGQLFASISQAWPLAQLMLFYLKLPELVLHNPPWPQQSCLRGFYQNGPLCTAHGIQSLS